MNAPRPPQPPEMKIVERKRRPRSIRQAAAVAGISESRWRLLERGYRDTTLGPAPEYAPDGTLARMAYAVGVTPPELAEAGRPEAAVRLEAHAAEQAAEREADEEAAAAGAAAAAKVRGLSARQRIRLEEMITEDVRHLRMRE